MNLHLATDELHSFFLTPLEFWSGVIVLGICVYSLYNHKKEQRALLERRTRVAAEQARSEARAKQLAARTMARAAREAARAKAETAISDAVDRVRSMNEAQIELARRAIGQVTIGSWSDAEKYVATWMGAVGFTNVLLSRRGADEGVDVEADGFVAQVKWQSAAVGRQVVQQIYGQAHSVRKQALFFSKSPYSKGATEFASGRVALFRYTDEGVVSFLNEAARKLAERLDRRLEGHEFSTALIAEAIAIPDPPRPEPPPRPSRSRKRRRYNGRRGYYRRY